MKITQIMGLAAELLLFHYVVHPHFKLGNSQLYYIAHGRLRGFSVYISFNDTNQLASKALGI